MPTKTTTRLQAVIVSELKTDRRSPYRVIAQRVAKKLKRSVSEDYVGKIARRCGLERTGGVGRAPESVVLPALDDLIAKHPEITDSSISGAEEASFQVRLERSSSALGISPPAQMFVDLILDNEPNEILKSGLFKSRIKETMAVLAVHEDENARKALAIYCEDPKLLSLLSEDESDEVRQSAANNSCTPLDSLISLSKDESDTVRTLVAENPVTPPSLLSKFVTDKSPYPRQAVAHLSDSPHDLLRLSTDEDDTVLANLARNTATPPDVLGGLSTHEWGYVRTCVANNQQTPPDVLRSMLKDESRYVSDGLGSNPSTPADVLTEMFELYENDVNMCAMLGLNPSAPKTLLKSLAAHDSSSVRENVARNSSLGVDVQNILADDKSSKVRVMLASNPYIGYRVREKLLDDNNVLVCNAAKYPDYSMVS